MTTLTGRAALLAWCQQSTAGYAGVTVKNFDTSFADGLAFCAIIHHHRPNALDFASLRASNALANHKLAFSLAQQEGVPALLDAEDMLPKPDAHSVMTYVIALYNVFVNGSMKGGSALSPRAPQTLTRTNSSPTGQPPKLAPASSSLRSQTPQPGPAPAAITAPAAPKSRTERASMMSRGTTEKPTCPRCGQPLKGDVIAFKQTLFHDTCFTCLTCRKAITGPCRDLDGEPQCKSCAEAELNKPIAKPAPALPSPAPRVAPAPHPKPTPPTPSTPAAPALTHSAVATPVRRRSKSSNTLARAFTAGESAAPPAAVQPKPVPPPTKPKPTPPPPVQASAPPPLPPQPSAHPPLPVSASKSPSGPPAGPTFSSSSARDPGRRRSQSIDEGTSDPNLSLLSIKERSRLLAAVGPVASTSPSPSLNASAPYVPVRSRGPSAAPPVLPARSGSNAPPPVPSRSNEASSPPPPVPARSVEAPSSSLAAPPPIPRRPSDAPAPTPSLPPRLPESAPPPPVPSRPVEAPQPASPSAPAPIPSRPREPSAPALPSRLAEQPSSSPPPPLPSRPVDQPPPLVPERSEPAHPPVPQRQVPLRLSNTNPFRNANPAVPVEPTPSSPPPLPPSHPEPVIEPSPSLPEPVPEPLAPSLPPPLPPRSEATHSDSPPPSLPPTPPPAFTLVSPDTEKFSFDEYLQSTILSGYLRKKDIRILGISLTETYFWFQLRAERLLYWKRPLEPNDPDPNPLEGSVSLRYCQRIDLSGTVGFKIVTPDRTYELEANTTTERQRWVDGLRRALEIYRRVEVHVGSNMERKEGPMDVKMLLVWKQQYLVLVDGMLFFYLFKGGPRINKIPLVGATLQNFQSRNKERHAFALAYDGATTLISSLDDDGVAQWMAAIVNQKARMEAALDAIVL